MRNDNEMLDILRKRFNVIPIDPERAKRNYEAFLKYENKVRTKRATQFFNKS